CFKPVWKMIKETNQKVVWNMLVKHLFCSLMERLDGLEEKWVTSNTIEQKQGLHQELQELRGISDEILDAWLSFEERLSQFNKEMELDVTKESADTPFKQIPDEVADKILEQIKEQ